MKTLLLAIALAGNIAALGQTDPVPATAPGEHGGQIVPADNSNPERDAHGVKVISDAAVAPAGYNQQGAVGGPIADPTLTPPPTVNESRRPCSRTVTDNCLQTYERGRRRR